MNNTIIPIIYTRPQSIANCAWLYSHEPNDPIDIALASLHQARFQALKALSDYTKAAGEFNQRAMPPEPATKEQGDRADLLKHRGEVATLCNEASEIYQDLKASGAKSLDKGKMESHFFSICRLGVAAEAYVTMKCQDPLTKFEIDSSQFKTRQDSVLQLHEEADYLSRKANEILRFIREMDTGIAVGVLDIDGHVVGREKPERDDTTLRKVLDGVQKMIDNEPDGFDDGFPTPETRMSINQVLSAKQAEAARAHVPKMQ